MGRVLKRVPLDFNWPMGTVWEGYSPTLETLQKLLGEEYPFLHKYQNSIEICNKCSIYSGECSESADYCIWHNPVNKVKWYNDVPKGDGYQLWETTTEGSPKSPVFETLDKLCDWCEDNATTFADYKATKGEWQTILRGSTMRKEGLEKLRWLIEYYTLAKEESVTH